MKILSGNLSGKNIYFIVVCITNVKDVEREKSSNNKRYLIIGRILILRTINTRLDFWRSLVNIELVMLDNPP